MSQLYARSYRWAANPIKLGEAITDLENAKKLNPAVVIDEEAIKARYVVRKGALNEIVAEATEPAPESEEKPKAHKTKTHKTE